MKEKVINLAVGLVNLAGGVAVAAVANQVKKVIVEPAVRQYITKGVEEVIQLGKMIRGVKGV